MCYFMALLPATALTIAGYIVLFVSGRSEGALRAFGRYLAFWTFTLAGLVILGAMFAAAHGGHRCPMFGMHGMHERMQGPWPGESRNVVPGGEEPHDAGPPADTPRPSQAPDTPTAPPR